MTPRAKLLSTGMYVPESIVSNALLAAVMDTSDAWIVQRTGIRTRHVIQNTYTMLQQLAATPDREAYLATVDDTGVNGTIDADMSTADLALAATRMALQNAAMTPKDLDLIIQTSVVPDYLFPGVACVLAHKLGLTTTPTFSLQQGCAGFVYALSMAEQYIKTGTYHTVLVVGAEVLSAICEYTTRGRDMAVLLADGAGAAIVVSAEADDPSGCLSHHLHTDGTLLDKLYTEAFGTTTFPPLPRQKRRADRVRPHMAGRAVFAQAVRRGCDVVRECLEANKLVLEEVDHFLFHQANARILEAIAETLGLPEAKVHVNIDTYGNTGSASIPILLHEAVQARRIKRGDLCLLAAFGTGFSWGASLLRW